MEIYKRQLSVGIAGTVLVPLLFMFGSASSVQSSQNDLDGNGYIDATDIGVFSENWLADCAFSDCDGADFDHSGSVDFTDYAALSRYWQQWLSDVDVVGWWRFDESSGATTGDFSGNGNAGTLFGAMTLSDWVAGEYGNALDFDGSDDFVSIMKSANGMGRYFTKDFTVAAWIKPNSINSRRTIVGIESTSQFTTYAFEGFTLELASGKPTMYIAYGDTNRDIVSANTTLTSGQWYHICVTRSGGVVTFYINGIVDASATVQDANINFGSDPDWYGYDSIGATDDNYYNQTNFFEGIIDDVRVYNRVVSYGTIMHLAQGDLAYGPDPANGSQNVSSSTLLKWWPGRLAQAVNGHDVYLGTNSNDVNAATSANPLGAYKGRQTAVVFDPGALAENTAYYWRIDEVNGPSVCKGTVWTFSTAQTGYTATASSSASGFDPCGACNGDRFLAGSGQAWRGDFEQSSWWWQLSFTNPTQVGSILQIVGDQPDYLNRAPGNYVWQWSADNSTWHDISQTAVSNERRMYRIHRFTSPISAQYWRISITSCSRGSCPVLREVEFYPQTDAPIDFPDWIVPVNIMPEPEHAYLPNNDVTRFIPLARRCVGWSGLKAQETLMQDFNDAFCAAEPRPLCAFLSGSYLDWCQVPGDAFTGVYEVLYNKHLPVWGSCGGCQLMGILWENGIPLPTLNYKGVSVTWDCPHCRIPSIPKTPIYTHVGHSAGAPPILEIACGDYYYCTGEPWTHGPFHIAKVNSDDAFAALPLEFLVWESHIGQITYLPTSGDWTLVATHGTDSVTYMQCMRLTGYPIYAAQFHIEMEPYTSDGIQIMTNFLDMAKAWGGYQP
jgi:hypothetical protein